MNKIESIFNETGVPVYVYEGKDTDIEGRSGFVLTSKGPFKMFSDRFVSAAFPVNEVPVMGELKPYGKWTGPKMPLDTFWFIRDLFISVYEKIKSECDVQLYWSDTLGKMLVRIPKQKVSGGSVDWELSDSDPWYCDRMRIDKAPEDAVHIGRVHSHNVMNAFWSGVDRNSHKEEFGIQIVMGHITTELCYKCGVAYGGQFFDCEIGDLVDFPTKTSVEIPEGIITEIASAANGKTALILPTSKKSSYLVQEQPFAKTLETSTTRSEYSDCSKAIAVKDHFDGAAGFPKSSDVMSPLDLPDDDDDFLPIDAWGDMETRTPSTGENMFYDLLVDIVKEFTSDKPILDGLPVNLASFEKKLLGLVTHDLNPCEGAIGVGFHKKIIAKALLVIFEDLSAEGFFNESDAYGYLFESGFDEDESDAIVLVLTLMEDGALLDIHVDTYRMLSQIAKVSKDLSSIMKRHKIMNLSAKDVIGRQQEITDALMEIVEEIPLLDPVINISNALYNKEEIK